MNLDTLRKWGIPGEYLGNTWAIPGEYLGNTHSTLETSLRSEIQSCQSSLMDDIFHVMNDDGCISICNTFVMQNRIQPELTWEAN